MPFVFECIFTFLSDCVIIFIILYLYYDVKEIIKPMFLLYILQCV